MAVFTFVRKKQMVDTHHFLWFCFVMASLKSFLYGLAPLLDMTGAALYERQRALTALGALDATPGRGPGSGVPLTADNIAAVVISVLAAENLSEVDKAVVDLMRARPFEASKTVSFPRGTTFKTEVGRALSGEVSAVIERQRASGISVTRPWRGRITLYTGDYIDFGTDKKPFFVDAINNIAEIDSTLLRELTTFTQGALTQLAEEEDDE
jgi:hypothetical protein